MTFLDQERRHPVVSAVVCGAAVAVLLALVLPAWAIVIPVTDKITLDFGPLPPWIGAVVAFAVYWEARKARKAAAEAVRVAAGVAVKVDGLLTDRDLSKVREGVRDGLRQGEVKAEALLEGQRQGAETERASVAAVHSTLPGAAPAVGSKSPLPVADDRTATASERVAEATERSADATARVATATEGKK